MWTVEARPAARKPDGLSLHADGPARDPGLGHQAAAADGAGRDRDQHDRRLSQAVPRHPRSEPPHGLRPDAPRRPARAREQQQQRRRRVHRAQGRAVPREHDRPHRDARRRSGRSWSRRATACRSTCATSRSVGIGQRAAHGCRDRERRGGRARHRLHADRREQPHGLAAAGEPARGRSTAACRRASSRARSTTAPKLVDATLETVAHEPARGRRARGRRAVAAARKSHRARSSWR